MMHVEFEDGTVADVFASDIVLGGIHNWLEVCANNHRAICNINPNTAMQTYNPRGKELRRYLRGREDRHQAGLGLHLARGRLVYRLSTRRWRPFTARSPTASRPKATISLAADAISTIYSAYVSADRKGAAVDVKTYVERAKPAGREAS